MPATSDEPRKFCDHRGVPVGEEPSRRAVLLGGGSVGALLVVSAAGCTSAGGTPSPSPTPTRATPPPGNPDNPDSDLALRRRVAVEVLALRAAYTAVIEAFPSLRRTVSGLAAEHDAHAAALDPATTPPATSPSTGPATTASLSRSGALRRLAALERAAATRRTADMLVAGPDLARLLASISACETTHAALLQSAT